mgnify:CR=1 FL=1
MQKTVLKNYAKLLARVGLNVQKGQEVIITAGLDQPGFVAYAAEECYRAGASRVRVEWSHQPLARLGALCKSEEVLSEVRPWQEEKLRCEVRSLPARLYIESEDPDGMNGTDSEKLARAMQARQRVIKPYRDKMENKYQWCIAAVPGRAWAKKVFPKDVPSAAEEKLWRAILSASRSLEGNPMANWQAHNEALEKRCAYLNSLGLASLEYESANGTRLRVGLLKEGLFAGGGERTLSGVYFNPNIPSEECFTSPKKGEAEGIVYSTKPLSYQGQLIRNFSVRFENGRAVEVHAAQGEAAHFTLGLFPDERYLRAYLTECAKAFFGAEDGSREAKLIEGESFSDCMILPPAGGKLSAELASGIAEEAILRPVEGDRKLFVLDAFHTVTPLVQNKLLKLLEEPPAGVFFLAGAASAHTVLPTVLSRANVFAEPPFSEEAIVAALARSHAGEKGIAEAAAPRGGGVYRGPDEGWGGGGGFPHPGRVF